MNLAYCLLHLGELAKAEAIYRRLNPSRDRDALLGLSEVLIRQGRPKVALQVVQAWLGRHPRDLVVIDLWQPTCAAA